LSIISVNALRPVKARAYVHTLAGTVADAPRPAALARRAAFRRSSAAGLRRLDLAGTRLA
jgi:hypothetical protein